ncbi:MAG: hypothetical protein E5X53_09965 [Mesorhizobium sp.]|uniref:hypothetical protein n=1 Tax=Mesorhizobium sp. TaxID=1871066 RepID=UPI0011FE1BC7|nr:hypothetical protein [Mesorhizobium sp.]TIP74024.1 MAG: hypothetical protein E5X55_10660 [Mesorhizobium sp.]TIQ14393.1 MAG: hypothetical protein E5X57_05140 [Mesorhizobium sp.]TIR52452.1 MAG: hypothetical protein E5X53_09965 [Mesorhizobium sp.]TJV95817.1 MAG: hypothetical protein E5X52_21975 [Mesorhizobium sp.]
MIASVPENRPARFKRKRPARGGPFFVWLRGHATTDTDIRWSWRFDTSGHFAWINVVAWMRTQFIDFVAFFWEKIDSFPHIVPNGPAP